MHVADSKMQEMENCKQMSGKLFYKCSECFFPN